MEGCSLTMERRRRKDTKTSSLNGNADEPGSGTHHSSEWCDRLSTLLRHRPGERRGRSAAPTYDRRCF